MKKVILSKYPHRQLHQKNGTPYASSAALTEILGFETMHIHHEILEAGQCSSAPHAHSHKREAFYVLSGELRARAEHQELALHPGEMILFEPGETHQLSNPGPKTALYFIFAQQHPQDLVTFASAPHTAPKTSPH